MTLDSDALGTFAEAVSAAETTPDGFGLADIAMVPSAWETTDGGVRSFGWVVELRHGERRYLEYKSGAGGVRAVAVTPLALDGSLPAAGRTARWFEPDPINRALRQRHAALASLLNNLP